MRILTGKYKGRLIHMPRGIRPTQDKVRKALFDILGDMDDVSFLELFAGSGAIGFEALSRGAKELTLVEYNRDCQLAIRRNIDSLKAVSCEVHPALADKAIRLFHKDSRQFDVIFLDPPYYQDLSKKTLHTLETCDILAPNGFIVVQHFKKDDLPETLGVFSLFKRKIYGDTVLSFYQQASQKDI